LHILQHEGLLIGFNVAQKGLGEAGVLLDH
jgi:hypothetical protein